MQQDFKPPVKKGGDTQSVSSPNPQPEVVLPPPGIASPEAPLVQEPKTKLLASGPLAVKSNVFLRWFLPVVFILITCVVILGAWFYVSLLPKESAAGQKRVTITKGSSLLRMASQLEAEGIIRSSTAFQLYVRLQNLQGTLQAGTYVFSPSQSVQDIAASISAGKVDAFKITIIPGQTLKEVKESLLDYGFTEESIDTALAASYDHPLLEGKPKNKSLEGYIFPDTYQMAGSGTPQDLFMLSFDAFYEKIQKEQAIQKLAVQNLDLYQGITLSSIVQKEVSDTTDQKQVAQVFLKRLREDIELGSDVTFIYAADQLGVEPRVSLESPYNTRKYKGLPPGPIANFNFSSMQAVASPAPGDYLYFVAGDDGKTYFARTVEEHERNVKEYCIELCKLF